MSGILLGTPTSRDLFILPVGRDEDEQDDEDDTREQKRIDAQEARDLCDH